jgi:hypothetical protein
VSGRRPNNAKTASLIFYVTMISLR